MVYAIICFCIGRVSALSGDSRQSANSTDSASTASNDSRGRSYYYFQVSSKFSLHRSLNKESQWCSA